MTPEEHRLVIWVLVRQAQGIKTIIEILKSRGLLQENDAEKFASAVFLDEASNFALLQAAKAEYLKLARELGVVTGLEKSP